MQTSTASEALIDHLHKHGRTRRFVRSISGLRLFYVDLSGLRLRLSDRAPFIEIRKELLEAEPPQSVFQTVRDATLEAGLDTRIPIFLAETQTEEFLQMFSNSQYKGRSVVLSESEIKRISESPYPSDALLAVIRNQVPLLILSPYEVTAPVTGSQFFGRETEIRSILNHPDTNYMIIGSRRLGKTSLLKEIQRRMQDEQQDSLDERTFLLEKRLCYLDCLAYKNSGELFTDLMVRLDPKQYNRLGRTDLSTYFPIFLRNIHKRVGGKIVFFMDEIDQLLKFDRQWDYEVTRMLMAGSSNGYCRLIWAGFREAREEMTRLDSPANAKFAINDLPPLRLDETRELVEMPMESLGVKMANREDIVKRIERDSGGHPNFVQHICQTLIKQLDRNGNREITPASLQQLPDDEAFRGRVIDIFTANTNDYEKAVAYAAAALHEFTIVQVDQRLKRLDIYSEIRELEQALSFLVYLGVIQQRGLVYHFTVPILPRLIHERYGSKFIREKAIEFQDRKIFRRP